MATHGIAALLLREIWTPVQNVFPQTFCKALRSRTNKQFGIHLNLRKSSVTLVFKMVFWQPHFVQQSFELHRLTDQTLPVHRFLVGEKFNATSCGVLQLHGLMSFYFESSMRAHGNWTKKSLTRHFFSGFIALGDVPTYYACVRFYPPTTLVFNLFVVGYIVSHNSTVGSSTNFTF